MQPRTKRKIAIVVALLVVAGIAYLVPYDFLSCKAGPGIFITPCFIRNALLTLFRIVPVGFAIAVAFIPRSEEKQNGQSSPGRR